VEDSEQAALKVTLEKIKDMTYDDIVYSP